jgi:hypothetical protein
LIQQPLGAGGESATRELARHRFAQFQQFRDGSLHKPKTVGRAAERFARTLRALRHRGSELFRRIPGCHPPSRGDRRFSHASRDTGVKIRAVIGPELAVLSAKRVPSNRQQSAAAGHPPGRRD